MSTKHKLSKKLDEIFNDIPKKKESKNKDNKKDKKKEKKLKNKVKNLKNCPKKDSDKHSDKHSDKNSDNDSDCCNKNKLLATNIYFEQASGILGGTFPSGKWITRSLNKINGNATVTLNANNTFTLKKGTYLINCKAPAFNVDIHQARLFNVTDNKTAKYGNSALASGNSSQSVINYFTNILKVPTTFKLQHRCQTAQSGNGLGIASGFPSNDTNKHFEIYGEIEIFQLN